MSLKNMTLLDAGTIAVTNGTALVFAEDFQQIPNGVHLVVPADADFKTRRQLTIKLRPATVNPRTGALSKDKKSMCYAVPEVQTDGSIMYSTVRVEREMAPSADAALAVSMNSIGAQMLTDSECAAFWASGVTS